VSWDSGLDPVLAWTVWYMDLVTGSDGYPLRVSSGYRSREAQEALWKARQAGTWPYPVAKPGTSLHELGRAVDLIWERTGTREPFEGAWGALGRLGEYFGLVWGGRFSTPDVVHFELPSEAP